VSYTEFMTLHSAHCEFKDDIVFWFKNYNPNGPKGTGTKQTQPETRDPMTH
jgi:hypothetical protein